MRGHVNFLSGRRRTGARSTRSASFLVGARRAVPLLFGDRTRSPTLWHRVLDLVSRLPRGLLQRALDPTPHHLRPEHHRQPASPPLHRALPRKSSLLPFSPSHVLLDLRWQHGSFAMWTVPGGTGRG